MWALEVLAFFGGLGLLVLGLLYLAKRLFPEAWKDIWGS